MPQVLKIGSLRDWKPHGKMGEKNAAKIHSGTAFIRAMLFDF